MILMPGSAAVPHLAATPYVPGSTMPMFDEPLSPQNEVNGLWNNKSVRQLIAPLTNSGRQFRFTLYKNGGQSHEALPIKNVSFEMQDTDFKTAQQPKEILFGGASGVPAGSGGDGPGTHGTVVSDWMELWHPIGPLAKMIVICDFGPAPNPDYSMLSYTTAQSTPNQALFADLKAWYRSGTSYNLAVPTGTWNVNNFWLGPIKKIEVR